MTLPIGHICRVSMLLIEDANPLQTAEPDHADHAHGMFLVDARPPQKRQFEESACRLQDCLTNKLSVADT